VRLKLIRVNLLNSRWASDRVNVSLPSTLGGVIRDVQYPTTKHTSGSNPGGVVSLIFLFTLVGSTVIVDLHRCLFKHRPELLT